MRFHLLLLVVFQASAGWLQADDNAAAIKYLRQLQQSDGSFLPTPADPKADPAPKGGLRATSAAVRALKYLGGEVPDRKAAAKFAESCFDAATGGFADRPGGKADVFLTAVGLMAAAELQIPAEKVAPKAIAFLTANAKGYEDIRIAVAGMEAVQSFPEVVRSWHQEVRKAGNGDGTWGMDDKPRATGGSVALLLRSGGKLDDAERKRATEALRAGQNADGGFAKDGKSASDLETTYRVMRAFHLLNEKPTNVPKLREFVGRCQNADGGSGAAPGQPSNVGGTYYAAIIGRWLSGK